MKLLLFYVLGMSICVAALGNGKVPTQLADKLPQLHQQLVKLRMSFTADDIMGLLDKLAEQIDAIEAVDLGNIEYNHQVDQLFKEIRTQDKILRAIKKLGKKTFHKRQVLDGGWKQLQKRVLLVRGKLAGKLLPNLEAFTDLPLIQKGLVLEASSENNQYSFSLVDVLNPDAFDAEASLFRKLIQLINTDWHYKHSVEKLHRANALIAMNLREVMPKTTALPPAAFATDYSAIPRSFKAVADVVLSGYPHVIEGLRQLSREEIRGVLFTTTKNTYGTGGSIDEYIRDAYDMYDRTRDSRNKYDRPNEIKRAMAQDLTPGGEEALSSMHFSYKMSTDTSYLAELARQIECELAAKCVSSEQSAGQ